MALSDLAVFSEYAYAAMTEVSAQQIDKFNAASRGAIQLQAAQHQGDFSDTAFFGKISGLVRRRNAYGTSTPTAKVMTHLVDTMVKVAAGTPPVGMDPGQFKWIQMNPELAGAQLGQQLAKDLLADMLNTGVMCAYAALANVAAVKYDHTAATPDTLTPIALNKGAALFGDRSTDIVAWLVHGTPMHDFYGNSLTNAQVLFRYETVSVIADPFGRLFVISDVPALFTAGSPGVYHTLGLTVGALRIDQNNDYTDNVETKNGGENIARTFQAEWTYNLGVKGFQWDKTNGGKSPNDAALATATNWDRIATSHKDLAGVVVETN